jgi:hypothetical protein
VKMAFGQVELIDGGVADPSLLNGRERQRCGLEIEE